jgi:hypothetical protein
MFIGPAVEVNPVERHAARADGDHGQVWPDKIGKKRQAHTQIIRGILWPQKARGGHRIVHTGNSLYSRPSS